MKQTNLILLGLCFMLAFGCCAVLLLALLLGRVPVLTGGLCLLVLGNYCYGLARKIDHMEGAAA